MMGYICNGCGKRFIEPKTYREKLGEFWGFPAYDTFSGCPFCGDDSIYEEGEKDDEYELLPLL